MSEQETITPRERVRQLGPMDAYLWTLTVALLCIIATSLAVALVDGLEAWLQFLQHTVEFVFYSFPFIIGIGILIAICEAKRYGITDR